MMGKEKELPDISQQCEFVVNLLFEIGPYSASGEHALSWLDIDAYARLVGIDFTAWQSRTLRRLAIEYIAALREFEDEDAPRPWVTETAQHQRAKVAAHVRNVLRAK